jgi:hypothetical protein
MVFSTKTDDYQKMCYTNKKVTKMGVIIKRIYFITHNLKFFGFFDKYQREYIFEHLGIIWLNLGFLGFFKMNLWDVTPQLSKGAGWQNFVTKITMLLKY